MSKNDDVSPTVSDGPIPAHAKAAAMLPKQRQTFEKYMNARLNSRGKDAPPGQLHHLHPNSSLHHNNNFNNPKL